MVSQLLNILPITVFEIFVKKINIYIFLNEKYSGHDVFN